jgi:parvulin-like peptidyl-prolyl isomerase
MRAVLCCGLALALLGVETSPGRCQAAAPASAAAPVPKGDAATVNGQPITELAVQRGLRRRPPETQAEARSQILSYLIDNTLLDQHLAQMQIDVPQKEVDARLSQVREEIKKESQSIDKLMQELMLSEEELRAQIIAEMRWDKYADAQATDKVLRDLFEKAPDMFDGTTVRASHILLQSPAGDAQAGERAKAQLLGFKKQIEDQVAAEIAKLPANTDSVGREKTYARALEEAFAAVAKKESSCPSKAQGGDLSWFPRVGSMVEPFAAAAFALKPHQMSDVLATPFGYHLILVTDRRPGKQTKFEDVREVVREVYCDRLRESICAQLKQRAKIVINSPTGTGKQ